MTRANEPAFPNTFPLNDGGVAVTNGLTKREIIAAMAMQGILSGLTPELEDLKDVEDWGADNLAKVSIFAADALLAELEKREGG